MVDTITEALKPFKVEEQDEAITESLELVKVDKRDERVDASKITDIAENKVSTETMATANRVISQKVATIINKRREAADLREVARMAEIDCRQLEQDCVSLKKESDEYKQKDLEWEAKNRYAKESRIVANRLDREAGRIEDGFNGEEFEKALAYKKSICGAKRQEAERLRHCAIKAEEDYYRLCKQAASVPPRLSERRVYIEAAAIAKEQAATATGTAANRLDIEADRIEEQILKAKQAKAKTLIHKVKEETKPIATEEAEGKTEVHKGRIEAKSKGTEEAQPGRKEREEDKTMTLMEYEKIREEKRKALKAKNLVAQEDGGKTGKEKGGGTKQGSDSINRDRGVDSKKNDGKPKKVNAQEVLNINRRSYYTRPPQPQYNGDRQSNGGGRQLNGGGGGSYPRRNFGNQRSSPVAPSKYASPPANSSRDFPPLEQN